ncbi:MAG: DUF6504 family protein [Betaproteobacteria bacterium]
MRLLDTPLQVRIGPDGRLAGFVWHGQWYLVKERLDLWRETGAWWEGEPEKTFFVVRTEPEGLFELYCAKANETPPAPPEEGRAGAGEAVWRLYKVYD